MVTGPCMVMQLQVASCVRIGLFPNVFAVVHCQAQYKMPYVLRRKTTAHLSCAITALFQRFVPGFHSDAFFLDFYMALLRAPIRLILRAASCYQRGGEF